MKPSEMRRYLCAIDQKAVEIINAISELREQNASSDTIQRRVAELIGDVSPVVYNVGKIGPDDVIVCKKPEVGRALAEKFKCFAIVGE